MRMLTPITAATVAASVVLVPAPVSGTVTAATAAPKQAVVTDVRVGRHDDFDRFVVQFRKAIPEFTVAYKKHLRMDGSGDKVNLKGRRNILVVLEPARAHRMNGAATIDSGEVVKYPSIREWRLLGDFEGVVSLGIGVRRKRAVEVTVLTHPKRLVVDVAH